MSNFYEDAKTVATGWATITSAGKSTVVPDNTKKANGTNKADIIKVAPIDHATRGIYSNGGNDFIDISGNYGILWSKATVKSGSGNDSIRIYADVDGIHPATVDIDSGVGNDFVSIYGGNNGFHGGTTGLTAEQKTSVSLNLGDGDDKLFIHGLREKGIDISKAKITGGKGNDLISIYGGSSGIGGWADYGNATVSIDGGSGADTIAVNSIDNYGDVTITAGAGDVVSVGSGTADYFFDSTKKVTINGAVFTAKSKNTSAKITTASNSIMLNSSWSGTIKLKQGQKLTDNIGNVFDTPGTYSIVSGKNVTPQIVRLTKNNDTYNNTSDSKIIYALSGDDFIYNSGLDVSILAGSGNDTVYNQGYNVRIDAGTGNDSVFTDVSPSYGSANYRNATVFGGDGVDTLQVRDHQTSLNGGAGNDLISVYSGSWENNTLQGSKGNDVIYGGSSNIFVYADGDGSDTIYYAKSGDTIQIATNNGYTSKKSGNDLIIKVGSGKMTFKDGANKSFNISTAPGTKKTQQDVIKAFMHSLDETSLSGTAALDEAVKYASGGKFKTYKSLIESFVKDCKKYSGDKFLKNYCGIDLSNKDTGAITGWDAGGLVVKTAKSVVEETGELDTTFTNKNFKVNGLNIQLAPFDIWDPDNGNPFWYPTTDELQYDDLSDDTQKYIYRAFKTWWAKNALNLISESYGDNYSFSSNSSATAKILYFGFINEDVHTLAETSNWENVTKLSMAVNMRNYGSLKNGGNSDGEANTVWNGQGLGLEWFNPTYLDRTIAHEMTHAVMMANIDNFGSLPQSIKEGMAELTHGIDDERNELIKELAKDSTKLKSALNVNDTGTGNDDAYAAGYMLLRYFAKQASNVPEGVHCDSDKTKILFASNYTGTTFNAEDYFSTIKEIDGSNLKSKVKLVGNSLANTINGGTKNDTLIGGAGADKLYGNAGKDSLIGGDGNDSLWGGKGADILVGGKGNDVFVYSKGDGKDVITDYTAGQDKIKISSGSISKTTVYGKDVIFSVGTGSITVKNGKGKKITVVDSNGNTKTYSKNSSANTAELWFTADDTNFATSFAQIDSITKNGLSDYSLGNVNTATDWTALTPTDSLTSGLTFSEK